eukprot:CAMPEP_0198706204 /NCGR_PEP_ID=MMETSP1468-20131203/390829_1 /TAXON_ID=1461545 /ORGANISM="Mantoniella sp, Strain CCMP1436" /LENGTH=74 /DNA_ID=CAMNT_0044465137 /DNA_START=1078 /DNA_END=1303 /DNA_ORIENTATION=-
MHPNLYPQAPSLLASDGFGRVAALMPGSASVGARGPAHDPAPSREEGAGQIGKAEGAADASAILAAAARNAACS